mgnify:CR=1 FL=1
MEDECVSLYLIVLSVSSDSLLGQWWLKYTRHIVFRWFLVLKDDCGFITLLNLFKSPPFVRSSGFLLTVPSTFLLCLFVVSPLLVLFTWWMFIPCTLSRVHYKGNTGNFYNKNKLNSNTIFFVGIMQDWLKSNKLQRH